MKKLRWGVAAIGMAMACGEARPGRGLVLVLDSDLTIPESIDEVGLYVEHLVEGRRTLVLAQEAKPLFDEKTGTYRLPFTQTFAIESNLAGGNDRIRARFVAYAPDGSVVGMREARSSLPKDHVRQLRLPIRFVNEGRVQDAQRTGPVPASDGVSLQQIAADARTDPFGRFRHAECAEDETLGDDGECAPIDVDLAQLAEGQVVVSSTTCFDTPTCFSGTEGVRELPIEAGCRVTIPERTGAELSLAIPVAKGYAVPKANADGTPGTARLQPVDAGLYELAGNVLTIESALCNRIERDAITSVLVSAKCNARSLDAPLCAAWQTVNVPAPATAGRFVGDPPDPGPGDASDGDADSSFPADADDASDGDGASEIDAGDVGFDRLIDLPAGTTSLSSFAANRFGAAWFLLDGMQPALLRMGEGKTSPAAPDPDPLPALAPDAFVELGADGSLYTMPSAAASPPRVPYVLRPLGAGLEPVRLGPGCAPAPSDLNFFTVGVLGDKTVAMYGAASSLAIITGGVAQNDAPDCFPASPNTLSNYATYLERGTTFGGKWRLPLVHDTQLAFLDPALGSTNFDDELEHPTTGAGVALQSFVTVSDDTAIAIGRSIGAESYDIAYFRVTMVGNDPKPRQIGALGGQGRWATREVFGAQGKVCGRLLRRPFSAEIFYGVECAVLSGVDELTSFEAATDRSTNDLHVYGDDTYLYVAKLCHDGTTPKRARIVARPWAQVTAASVETVLVGCSNPGN